MRIKEYQLEGTMRALGYKKPHLAEQTLKIPHDFGGRVVGLRVVEEKIEVSYFIHGNPTNILTSVVNKSTR